MYMYCIFNIFPRPYYYIPPNHWFLSLELRVEPRLLLDVPVWLPIPNSRWQGSWPVGVQRHPIPTTITSITPRPETSSFNISYGWKLTILGVANFLLPDQVQYNHISGSKIAYSNYICLDEWAFVGTC